MIDALARAAGLADGSWRVTPIESIGLINSHHLVDVDDGRRFVVREYGWPWPGEEQFDRGAKESWLLPRLEASSVPAPRVVATAPGGLLLTYVDGVPLAERSDRTDAMWRNTGAALRAVHDADIGLPPDTPVGMIVAGGVDPFPDGWAQWHVDNTRLHADAVAAGRPDLGVDAAECVATVEAARELIEARPRALVHTDANPWNVLVADDATATWVDWEFAWWADPLYDFVRMALARKHDLGPLPRALFDGYGEDPTVDPVFAVYELGFQLWMAHEAMAPLLPLQVTYAAADTYLRDLDAHLARLAAASG